MTLASEHNDRPSRALPAFAAALTVGAGLSVLTWATLQPRPGAPAPAALFATPPATFAAQTAPAPEPQPLPEARAAVAASTPNPSPAPRHVPHARFAAAAPPPAAVATAAAEPAQILPPPSSPPISTPQLKLTPPNFQAIAPRPATPPPTGDAPIPSHAPG